MCFPSSYRSIRSDSNSSFLSYRCADYVKHLAKSTKEKEELVEKAKTDLEMSERKLEEDKASQERSDFESVASSLTSGSRNKKRKDDRNDNPTTKKAKTNESLSDSSSNEGQGIGGLGGPGLKKISLNKMSSSMSDVTDCLKGYSESGDGNDDKSSDNQAAGNEDGKHADVVVKVWKQLGKRPVPEKNKEITSLDPEFELDYQEVFVSSNVPQLIATPAGRIVTCT